MAGNENLRKANAVKEDEFYTQLSDIENELKHYKKHFKDKIVFCNCDDPYESNFFKYFALNFNYLGLRKLIATCYDGSPIQSEQISLFDVNTVEKQEDKKAYKIEITEVDDYNGDGAIDLSDVEHLIKNKKNVLTMLEENGDFRSDECVEILKEADIVVTNPPFSKFREFVSMLIKNRKKFLIIGNKNSITYKEIFPLLKNNEIWLGYSAPKEFMTPNGMTKKVSGLCRWFTNLDIQKRHEEILLWKQFNQNDFLMYDNYTSWNVNKVVEIPVDDIFEVDVNIDIYKRLQETYKKDCNVVEYDKKAGLYKVRIIRPTIGVPITFLDNYNPEQFEIVDALNRYSLLDVQNTNEMVRKNHSHTCNIDGKPTYFRIIIRRKV